MKKGIDFKLFSDVDYAKSWMVFTMDMVISIMSSLISLTIAEYLCGMALTFHSVFYVSVSCFVVSAFIFRFFRTYRNAIRHSTVKDISRLFLVAIAKTAILYPIIFLISELFVHFFEEDVSLFSALIDFLLMFSLLAASRFLVSQAYSSFREYNREKQNLKRVLVYGSSEKAVALLTRLDKSPHYDIAGFIEFGTKKTSIVISGKPLFHFSGEKSFENLVRRYSLDGIIFTTAGNLNEEHDRLFKYAYANNVTMYTVPEIDEITGNSAASGSRIVRRINIEDLLGRPEIKINFDRIRFDFRGKTILVTGAAGSIGSELVRQLSQFNAGNMILFDNAETPLHNLRLELEGRYPQLNFVPIIGDVRQIQRLDYVFRKWHPQIVFHAAAYKHVPLMEENPCEAVLVNVVGSRNVADKVLEFKSEKMIMISTDKAVNPTNVMGCTKRLAEMYIQSIPASECNNGVTQFITTRFGNVLGSNGSVIPRFRQQIENGGPVTVTHPEITRFFMTIPEACRLVMEAACLGRSNRIFVFDMGESVKIADLARRMIEISGFVPDKDIKIEYTGLRPGEKLYEEVLANAENTESTTHERILVAKVRDVSYDFINEAVNKLKKMAIDVQVNDMVKYMKEIVPEYISHNSIFCEFDKK